MKSLSIIIPEYNEYDLLIDTVKSIQDTIDIEHYEIIIVHDGSDKTSDLSQFKNIVEVFKKERSGVGNSFDIGVSKAQYKNLAIMGADIRFRKNNWATKLIEYINRHPKHLICPVNLGLNMTNKKDVNDEKLVKRYGAEICLFLNKDDLPPKGSVMKRLATDEAKDNYRNIFEAKWIPEEEEEEYDIPCVLGAFYGVNKDWYDYIKGFKHHKYWGTLEPYISLKSWFAGGGCKLVKDIEIGHIYTRPNNQATPDILIYNKLVVALLLFPRDKALIFINYLGDNPNVAKAKSDLLSVIDDITKTRNYLEKIFERDIHWFYQKFKFKHYDFLGK